MFRIVLCLLAASGMLAAGPPPFSFVYDGNNSAGLLPAWRSSTVDAGADAFSERRQFV